MSSYICTLCWISFLKYQLRLHFVIFPPKLYSRCRGQVLSWLLISASLELWPLLYYDRNSLILIIATVSLL